MFFRKGNGRHYIIRHNLNPLQSLCSTNLTGNGRLPQRQSAIIRGYFAVQQNHEAVGLQKLHSLRQQGYILPDTAAEGNFVQASARAQIVTYVTHYAGDAVVEAGGDSGNGGMLAQISKDGVDEGGGVKDEG